MIARQAVLQDWPGIEALRDACYDRWGMPVQARDDLSWLVAEQNGCIVAAMGYSEPIPGNWNILDWYAEPGPLGIRAGSAVLKLLLAEADTKEKTICGVSCFEPFIAVAMKRGFQFAGVALVRQPGGTDASIPHHSRSHCSNGGRCHGRSKHAAESDHQGR